MFINRNICFVESQSNNINYTIRDNSSISDDIPFRLKNKINIIIDNKLYCNLKVCVFSDARHNELINSSIYRQDKKYESEGTYQPYIDSEKHISKLSTQFNPIIYRNRIGNNYSEEFDDFATEPYREIEYFNEHSELINYRFYLNSLYIQRMMQSIDMLNSINEINGNLLSEVNFKGVRVYFNNSDSMNNYHLITNEYNIDDPTIVEFLDQQDDNNINTDSNGLTQVNYKYEVKYINGIEYIVLLTDGNSRSNITTLTSDVLFYNERESNILPFNDSLTESEARQNVITSSTGSDSDASSDELITCVRLGEIN
jgi:hypothetical protein